MTTLTAAPRGGALRVRTVEVDDPGDLLSRVPEPRGLAWVRHGEGIVGWGNARRVRLRAGDPFAHAAAVLAELRSATDVTDEVELPGTGLVAFVSFTFDIETPGSVLIVPSVVLGRAGGRAWLTTLTTSAEEALARQEVGHVHAAPAPTRIRYAGASISEVRWLDAVAAATREIRRGELDKVVLARDLAVWSESVLDERALTRRLAEHFPSCFTFSCDGLVGATPELLVRRQGDVVDSVVLAGTAPRAADPAADREVGEALLRSAKDRDEHHHAVESVRAPLQTCCDPLEITGPALLRLENVQHLATSFRGMLRDGSTVLDLVAALHPTAAVCGTPTKKAMALITELEGMDRGRYAGPVGWVDAAGDGELGIALRCAEVDGDRARLFAGAGIMGASLPEAELEETRIKLLAMQAALST
jgi:menaquinone-specific isochorismate synthase